jgi:hypothetical protein
VLFRVIEAVEVADGNPDYQDNNELEHEWRVRRGSVGY